MLDGLRRIRNPLVRSITAGVTVGSTITLAAAIAIGVSSSKHEAAYKSSVYAALLGMGGGALLGLVSGSKGQRFSVEELKSSFPDDPTDPVPVNHAQTWQDWRNFIVVRKVKESEEITSFYLQPEDQTPLANFQPGQFLTIKLEIPGQAKPVIRTYSLSDDPEPCEYYRLSIKREPAPQGSEVPPGLASNFMHDQIQEGSVIPAKPPSGKFVLDVQSSIPVVLISNGVGITPMISMVKACSRLNPDRPIWFLHGARDGRFHAFRDEVQELASQNPNLKVHFAYSRPRPEDESFYQSTGYVDAALVQTLVSPEAEFFLCGSPPFLRSLMAGLKAWEVPESRIFFESFGQSMKAIPEQPASVSGALSALQAAEITFAQSGKTLDWNESQGSILEFAEANGLNPDYSCRAGICGTCRCSIREGEVEYLQPPTAEMIEGSVLICISKPKTARVVLEL